MSKQREQPPAREDRTPPPRSAGRRFTHPYIQKSRSHWGWDCGYDSAWEDSPEISKSEAGDDTPPGAA